MTGNCQRDTDTHIPQPFVSGWKPQIHEAQCDHPTTTIHWLYVHYVEPSAGHSRTHREGGDDVGKKKKDPASWTEWLAAAVQLIRLLNNLWPS